MALSDYSEDPADHLSTQERGWIAVIDGELRDWSHLAQTKTGYLAVEHATACVGKRDRITIREHVDNALAFLSHEGKIRNWKAEESDSYTFFEILY